MTAAILGPATADFDLPRLPAVIGDYDGPSPSDVKAFREMAEWLAEARSALQPEYQRRSAEIGTLMLRAKSLRIELGIAIDHIFINGRGKAGLSAQLVAYLLRRAGIDWDTVETPDYVEMHFYRTIVTATKRGRRTRRQYIHQPVRFEMIEAVNAKVVRDGRVTSLADTYHWRTWPIPCMWARCLTRAARRYFTDICMGMAYLREELTDGTAAATVQDTAAGDNTRPVRDDVDEFVQQALSDDATPELIQTDIMVRAKKAKLLEEHAGDDLTLKQMLLTIWDTKVKRRRDQEIAIPADTAQAAAHNELPAVTAAAEAEASWAALPVGEGTLPCHCPASVLITSVHIEGVCAGVLAAR